MPINAVCNGCRETYSLPDDYAGQQMQCANCGQVFLVPAKTPADPRTEFGVLAVLAEAAPDGMETGGVVQIPSERPSLRRRGRAIVNPNKFGDVWFGRIIILAFLGAGLIYGLIEAISSRLAWVELVMLVLAAFLLVAMVLPITVYGIRLVRDQRNFDLVPKPHVKTLAMVSPLAAVGGALLTYAIAHSPGLLDYDFHSFIPLLIGAPAALLCSLPLVYGLYVIEWTDALLVWSIGFGFFIVSALVEAVIVISIGFVLAYMHVAFVGIPAGDGPPDYRNFQGLLGDIDRADYEAKKSLSASNLKEIGSGIYVWTQIHGGSLPPRLSAMPNIEIKKLNSPFGDPYEYKHSPNARLSDDMVVASDGADLHYGQGANILFGDGAVTWFPASQARKIIAAGRRLTKP